MRSSKAPKCHPLGSIRTEKKISSHSVLSWPLEHFLLCHAWAAPLWGPALHSPSQAPLPLQPGLPRDFLVSTLHPLAPLFQPASRGPLQPSPLAPGNRQMDRPTAQRPAGAPHPVAPASSCLLCRVSPLNVSDRSTSMSSFGNFLGDGKCSLAVAPSEPHLHPLGADIDRRPACVAE